MESAERKVNIGRGFVGGDVYCDPKGKFAPSQFYVRNAPHVGHSRCFAILLKAYRPLFLPGVISQCPIMAWKAAIQLSHWFGKMAFLKLTVVGVGHTVAPLIALFYPGRTRIKLKREA